MAFELKDYVDVHKRIEKFYEKYPEGSIQTEIVEKTDSLVVVKACVYRKPDDQRPSIAHSQLGIPGKTNYTRDSEIENAETSAVGRAIAFLGFEVKNGIASEQEVRNKKDVPSRAKASVPQETPREATLPFDDDAPPPPPAPKKLERPEWMKEAQLIAQKAGLRFKDIPALRLAETATATDVVDALKTWRLQLNIVELTDENVLAEWQKLIDSLEAVPA